jgi:hypothetical protein
MNNRYPKPRTLARCDRPIFWVLLAAALLLAVTQSVEANIATDIIACHYALADGTKLTGYLSLPPEYRKGERYPVSVNILIRIPLHPGKDYWRSTSLLFFYGAQFLRAFKPLAHWAGSLSKLRIYFSIMLFGAG